MLFVPLIKTVTPGIQDLLDIQVAAFGSKVSALLKALYIAITAIEKPENKMIFSSSDIFNSLPESLS